MDGWKIEQTIHRTMEGWMDEGWMNEWVERNKGYIE